MGDNIMKNVIIKTRSAVRTHVGMVRQNNEDNFLLSGIYYNQGAVNEKNQSTSGWNSFSFHALMDGLGGQNAGEVASGMAAALFSVCFGQLHKKQPTEGKIKKIQETIYQANKAIYEKAASDVAFSKMGTTFTGLLLDNASATVMHLGDSRAYLLRSGQLTQLMVDHTEAERMVRLGLLKREDVRGHRSRFLLNRNLGVPPEYGVMQAERSQTFPILAGDLFLLCSDGLTDMVSDESITHILTAKQSLEQKCDQLIQTALSHGGEDNVTVLLTQVERISRGLINPRILVEELHRWIKKGKLK